MSILIKPNSPLPPPPPPLPAKPSDPFLRQISSPWSKHELINRLSQVVKSEKIRNSIYRYDCGRFIQVLSERGSTLRSILPRKRARLALSSVSAHFYWITANVMTSRLACSYFFGEFEHLGLDDMVVSRLPLIGFVWTADDACAFLWRHLMNENLRDQITAGTNVW